MLELNYIRENAAEVAQRLAIKNIDAAETLQKKIGRASCRETL